MKKILAVASIGGHWVQLLRIAKPLEEHYEVVYIRSCVYVYASKMQVNGRRLPLPHDIGFQPLGCMEDVAGFI